MTHTIADQKDQARKAAFAARKLAHAAARDAATDAAGALARHTLALLDGRPATNVSGYLPIRTEIDPRPAMAALVALGHRVCVPVIPGAAQPLRFREWSPECALTEGPFGAQVPQAGDWLVPQVLLCPLLCFDAAGYRLGYGGGFYDRTLQALRASATQTRAYGLAYAAQEVPQVIREATDQRLDGVITEAGLRRFDG